MKTCSAEVIAYFPPKRIHLPRELMPEMELWDDHSELMGILNGQEGRVRSLCGHRDRDGVWPVIGSALTVTCKPCRAMAERRGLL